MPHFSRSLRELGTLAPSWLLWTLLSIKVAVFNLRPKNQKPHFSQNAREMGHPAGGTMGDSIGVKKIQFD